MIFVIFHISPGKIMDVILK